MLIICLLGAPGSGKGTIGRKLAEDLGLLHFSIGDFLRASRTAGRFDDKNEVLLCLDQGRLLPSEYMLPLLEAKIEAGKQLGHRGIILDGFPRSLSQGIEFETSIQKFNLVIYLQCPREIVKQRFLDRKLPDRIHQDNETMFDKRFHEHEEKSPTVIQYYDSIGILVKVDSSGEPELTYTKLFDILKGGDFQSLVMRI